MMHAWSGSSLLKPIMDLRSLGTCEDPKLSLSYHISRTEANDFRAIGDSS